ncbi:MAG TPA: hypothetical protein VGB67_01560 [Fibrella sp.]
MKHAKITLLALALLIALLLVNYGCTGYTRMSKKPHSIAVVYNDNFRDTLSTFYWYKTGKTVYIHECSCDGTVTYLKP